MLRSLWSTGRLWKRLLIVTDRVDAGPEASLREAGPLRGSQIQCSHMHLIVADTITS